MQSLALFRKNDGHLRIRAAKKSTPDQKITRYCRQNPIQLSKSETNKNLETTKLLD